MIDWATRNLDVLVIIAGCIWAASASLILWLWKDK